MFSSDPGLSHTPFAARARGIAIGSVLLAAMVGMQVASRAAPFYLLALLLVALAAADWRRAAREWAHLGYPHVLPLLVFFGYAALSAAWARDPVEALGKSGTAAAFVVASVAILIAVAQRTRVERPHMMEGLWIGLLAGLAFAIVETFSGQAIVRGVVNLLGLPPGSMRPPEYYRFREGALVWVSPVAMARNVAPITLILWPALAAIAWQLTGAARRAVAALALGAAAVVIFASTHETSKLALIVGGVAWLLVRYAPRAGIMTMRAGWLAACLLPVPIAMALHALALHEVKQLPYSMRQRVEIWNRSAVETLAAPLLGSGAMSTYVAAEYVPRAQSDRQLQPHQHNAYLQVWNELGLIGALLLAFAGWRLLDRIGRLSSVWQPYGYATMASGAAVAASSYGIWQIWFMAAYAISAVAFAVGIGLASRRMPGDDVRALSGGAA